MTRAVLVSQKLAQLHSGIEAVDRWIQQHLQVHVARVFEQIAYLIGSANTFTAAIAGSGTAGTYEIATQNSRYYRTGDLVYATIDITLAGAITGGGVGNLTITGLPFYKQPNHNPAGAVYTSGVDMTPGVHAVCMFDSTTDQSKTLVIAEVNDNAAAANLVIGSLAANDRIIATIVYIAAD